MDQNRQHGRNRAKNAAEYERMSREEVQQYSKTNQMDAIREYAKKHGFIVSKNPDDEKGGGKA